ncbi:HK97-gp10 family putative phage morphogenesis protein [Macrococcoides caseolyticum]|uniref:HK97-gp10 family putative phage morphogenesis protein n=1 Tax=Macrococcoides caseolyticum TaxID=69966 RepID=UPI0012FEEFAA|nr:HK97-gp10 family putative phage morphogenesis protein [Macrococcus caseolyticus]
MNKLLMNINGARNKVVQAGTEVQFKAIKKDIFVDTGKARDRLIIGKPHQRNGETIIKIGWPEGSKVEYRAHFVEWGTVHQKPQMKITNAVKNSMEAKKRAMNAVMRREYGLNG